MIIRFNHLMSLAAFGSFAIQANAADKYWTGAITAYYQDGSGAITYNGIQYSPLTSGTFSVTTVADANFIAGGYVCSLSMRSPSRTSPRCSVALARSCFCAADAERR